MKNSLYHYPTVAELRALEIAARRARAREVARLLRTGARALKSFVEGFFAMSSGRRIGHA
jgi:hypothetical protein